jgi:hypothetical protein
MIKPVQLKSFKVGYGDDLVVFHPRMISLAEQTEAAQRFNDIADGDDQKYQKEFDIQIEAIAEWSNEQPQRLVKEKAEFKRVPLVEDSESTLDALKRFFGDRTAENERVIRAAYNAFINQCAPDVSFL